MKTKIIQFVPALIVLVTISFRYFSNWCIDAVSYCYGTWIHQIALSATKPLYFFSLYLLPIAFILAFVSRPTFNSWLKFAVWSVPLLLIFIATQPVAPGSFLSTDRDDAARLAGQVFTVASLILIAWKYVVARQGNS